MGEVEEKLGKIRDLMVKKGATSILITRNDNFSWITAGGRGWVVSGKDTAVAWILVMKDEVFLISNNIESERLLNNEVSGNFVLKEYRWYENPWDSVEGLLGDRPASDTSMEGFLNLSKDMKELRMVLSRWEIERARRMGMEIEGILEATLERSDPEMTELELAGILKMEFGKRGYNLPVVLVFSERNRKLYRHNLPTEEKLGRFFFASVCAEKYGMVLSVTRSVAFGRPNADIEEQHILNAKIDAQIVSKTRVGKSLKDMFFEIRDVYSENGVPMEFEKHHQGGVAGYNSREEKATPSSEVVLKDNMIIAWNPTITGTKSEDTFLLTKDSRVFLTFTEDSNWPKLRFEFDGEVLERPGIMVL